MLKHFFLFLTTSDNSMVNRLGFSTKLFLFFSALYIFYSSLLCHKWRKKEKCSKVNEQLKTIAKGFVYFLKMFWYHCEILVSENTMSNIGHSMTNLIINLSLVVPE